jgi:hypothetical protein
MLFEAMKKILLCLLLALVAMTSMAQKLSQWYQDVHGCDEDAQWYQMLTYSTSYFGPNALPVPEISDGKVPDRNSITLSPELFWGYGDWTQSLSVKLIWAVVPGVVSINGWGVIAEHYKTTLEVRNIRASLEEKANGTRIPGDWYISTTLALMKQTGKRPDLSLDIVLKSASVSTPADARFMDTPGYFFSLTSGKTYELQGLPFSSVRLIGCLGFFSYQLNSGNQNDGPLYGFSSQLNNGNWQSDFGIHGYSGWKNFGDRPLVLRGKVQHQFGRYSAFVQYQHPLNDFPHYRIQTGLKFDF